MAVYDYECAGCGDFTLNRPMAEFRDPQPCPGCGTLSPRVMNTAPAFSTGAATASAELARPAARRHAAGCGCCAGGGWSRTFG